MKNLSVLVLCFLVHSCTLASGYPPLFEALRHGDLGRFKALLDAGENPDIRIYFTVGKIIYGPVGDSRPGSSLLFVAAKKSDCGFVQSLISHGASLDIRNDEDGATPLFGAIEARNNITLDLLIRAGSEVNMRQTKITRSSPLEWAIVCGNYHAAYLLLQANADSESARIGKSSVLDVARRAKGSLFYREEEPWCERVIALLEARGNAIQAAPVAPAASGR